MKKKDLSQERLGELIGAEQGVVQRWVRNKTLPEGKYMVQLPGALGLSGHYLLTGQPPKEPPGEAAANQFDVAKGVMGGYVARRLAEVIEATLKSIEEENAAVLLAAGGALASSQNPLPPPGRAGKGTQ